jgi:probable F420-dependent oxidoreductase
MRFGVQVGHVGWTELRDLVQTVEALGFATLYFPDHLVHEGPERQSQDVPADDPIVQAAVAIEASRRLRIGHLVLCNLFRHPAVTARSLASLDRQSGGRVIAGLGAGWTETEFRMTGLPFPDVAARLRMLDEALVCLLALWRTEPFTFAGEFYRLEDAVLHVEPVQKPHPPVLLGGSGRGLLRIAAARADQVNVITDTGRAGYISMAEVGRLTDAAFRTRVAFLRDEAVRCGRDPREIEVSQTLFTVMLTDSVEATRATAEAFGGMLHLPPEEVLRSPLTLIGTPDECIAELRRRDREWNLAETIFAVRSTEQLRRLGTEILPHV